MRLSRAASPSRLARACAPLTGLPPGSGLQGDVDVTRMSPWLLRIEMARDMMVDKKLLLSEVEPSEGGRGWASCRWVANGRHSVGLAGHILATSCMPWNSLSPGCGAHQFRV